MLVGDGLFPRAFLGRGEQFAAAVVPAQPWGRLAAVKPVPDAELGSQRLNKVMTFVVRLKPPVFLLVQPVDFRSPVSTTKMA